MNGKPLNSWSKRLLYEIRMLIRRHADEHQDEMTIGQVTLLGTALREMGASMADTAALADILHGTDRRDEADVADLENPTLKVTLDEVIDRPVYEMREDEGETDWSIERLLDEVDRGEQGLT